jgi:putative acetyltransferase
MGKGGPMIDFEIRLITPGDNEELASIIRDVLKEFGADRPGFAFTDPELDRMFETYHKENCAYYVVEYEGKVIGGAGIAPLAMKSMGESSDKICELQKMYFLSEVRGRGIGQSLIQKCLEFAKDSGYGLCYIETLDGMDMAKALYLKNGFTSLNKPLGDTGHFNCDAWYSKKL